MVKNANGSKSSPHIHNLLQTSEEDFAREWFQVVVPQKCLMQEEYAHLSKTQQTCC